MNILIHEEAESDLFEGYIFYESQESGLGDYFLDSLFSDIDSLQLYAGIHPVKSGYYRLLSQRFPYAVYYKMEEQSVHVWAVLDCRQNPGGIEKHLSERS